MFYLTLSKNFTCHDFSGPTLHSSPIRRRHRGVFNPRVAKNKWTAIERNVNSVINKKQTITNIEKDMDIWLKVGCFILHKHV